MQTVTIDKTQGQEFSKGNFPVLMTMPDNLVRNSKNKANKKSQEQLSIHGYKLQKWLDSLKNSDGVYYLDLDLKGLKHYSMHFCHHIYNEVMELDYSAAPKPHCDAKKEFLLALLFDLSLFPDEPILVFDREKTEECLRSLAKIYYEHAFEITSIIYRLTKVDVLEVFKGETYHDPAIKDFTLSGIYHSLYPGTSITFPKIHGSYEMHLIIIAVKSTFYQLIGRKKAA
jgi:hypothetical protein